MTVWKRACSSATTSITPLTGRRWLSTYTLDRLAKPVQSYISTSRDPYVNLSIEHFLLQKTAPESAILLLYVNRPSIIIGRNQNPWLEVNLALLNPSHHDRLETEPPGLGSSVDLVRRRSGGGTVFHDEGNVNWTVISPSASFTRDKHAEMVVRALRSCGIDRSRVNERHDIVLDQGERGDETDIEDTHSTPYHSGETRPLKFSGSAYKLTRGRALHHGTCLLSSPNLNIIPHYLHSPAKPYISARGVESVSSPVGNILISNADFIQTVQQQFSALYHGGNKVCADLVGENWLDHEPIKKGHDELKSQDWTYLQTPQFSISTAGDPTINSNLELTVRNGSLTGGSFSTPDRSGGPSDLPETLIQSKLHEIRSWDDFVKAWLKDAASSASNGAGQAEAVKWLHRMLPPASAR